MRDAKPQCGNCERLQLENATLRDKRSLQVLNLEAQLETAKEDNATLQQQLQAEREKVRQLTELLRNLVSKLDAVHADKRYESVWTIYQIHGGNYQGPFYKDELDAARAELEKQLVTADEGKT